MLGNCIENVRKNVPLVHNITNYVTVNDVANVLLACGGSPIMSDEPEDVKKITSICGGLNINIGTLSKRSIEGMFAAGARANELGHATLLDPVGAGASTLRTNTAVELMEKIRFDVIRGNISEVKTLAQGSGTTKGVDADVTDAVTEENLEEGIAFAKAFAKKAGCIVAITGAIDLVSDADRCYVIRNGRPEMGKITGTGCQLSGMMTAFLTANPEQKLEAAAAGCTERRPAAGAAAPDDRRKDTVCSTGQHAAAGTEQRCNGQCPGGTNNAERCLHGCRADRERLHAAGDRQHAGAHCRNGSA